MFKSLACIALFFAVYVAAHRGPNGRPWGPRPGGNGNRGQWWSNLCANQTLAQQFLTQTQQLISTLQSNGSFTRFLEDRAQTIAYIQNADNTALLSSNCTAYVTGLQNAKSADRAAGDVQRQYYRSATNAMKQIIRNLFGFGSDSSEDVD